MKPLPSPRRVPEGNARFIVLDVPAHGPHAFRLPSYGRCSELIQFVQSAPPAPATIDGTWRTDDPAWAAFQVGEDQTSGVLLGTCWYHEAIDLEAKREGRPLTAYGEAVVDEMMDHGYRAAEYHALAARLYERLVEFHHSGRVLQSEAREEGNVSPAPGRTNST